MIYLYYIFAALLVLLSYRSFRSGIAYLSYFRSEIPSRAAGFHPFTTIVIPCKGNDVGLAENLIGLLEQDHPEYEVIFVVEDISDPAVSIINSLIGNAALRAELVVAGRSSDASQKVENLREGVLHASERSEVFVFADSDMRPPANWLSSLVAPLQFEKVGAATGYRWFVSEGSSLPSELRSAWNASIASALGADVRTNFCWGGSMAIRRDVFERLNIRENWKGTLSDDFAVTRAIQGSSLDIRFVPAALVPSHGECTFAELLEFTNRQMKITRTNAPGLWALSFFGSALFNIVMLASVTILIVDARSSWSWMTAAVTLSAVSFFSIAKSIVRMAAVEIAIPQHRRELGRQKYLHAILWAVTPMIFLLNSLVALVSRRINWRGVEYEMVSHNETRLIRRL
mgnify:CR=1 FL=1